MGIAYSLTSHLVALLGDCKRFGHVWLLDKEQNCWVCDRCPTELWVSQMNSYRSRRTVGRTSPPGTETTTTTRVRRRKCVVLPRASRPDDSGHASQSAASRGILKV